MGHEQAKNISAPPFPRLISMNHRHSPKNNQSTGNMPENDTVGGTVRRIARNSLYILVSRIIEMGAGLIIVVLVANYLGAQKFGGFSFIRAVAFVLSPFVVFGSIRIIVREIAVAKERTTDFIFAGIALNIWMGLVVAIVTTGIIPVFDLKTHAEISALYLAIIAQICGAIKNTINAGFLAHEVAHFSVMTNLTNRLFVILAVVLIVVLKQNFLMLFIAIAIANMGTLGISLYILKLPKIITGKPKDLIANTLFLIKESYPIAIVMFMVQGYTYVNTFFLRFFHDNWHVAMFEASQRIILPLSVISTSILLGFVPTLSRLGKNTESHDQLFEVYATTLKFFFLVTFPVCAFVTVAAEPIILTMYKNEFAPAAKTLTILIWAMIPLFVNGLLNFILTSLYKQKLLLISNTACFVVNIVLSWLLVKDYSFIGISYATLIAYLILFGINLYFVNRLLGPVRLLSMTLVPGLITLLFCYSAKVTMFGRSNSIILAISYVMVYLLLLFVTKTISIGEIKVLFHFLKRKRDRSRPRRTVVEP